MEVFDTTALARDRVIRRVAVPLLAIGAIGLFGGLLLENPLVMVAGLVAFFSGLSLRVARTEHVINELPPLQSRAVRTDVSRRTQRMYVAVLIGFVAFVVRFFILGW
jgi:hypothetical protein